MVTRPSFAARTLAGLRDRWRDRSRRAAEGAPLRVGASLEQPTEVETLRSLMRECLEARGGQVSARARAARLAATWLTLSPAGRSVFLRALAGFDRDHERVADLAGKLAAAPGDAALEEGLFRALSAPRIELLRQLASVPDGVKLVVDLRADLLDDLGRVPSGAEGADAEHRRLLEGLDADIYDLLAGWFDVAFLELRRISWDSPASLLEKVIAYEAVHRIDSWADLRNRLDTDRRVYGFFHSRMPDEPLIFVEIALVRGASDNVQRLLDLDAPASDAQSADTAVFYSISNAQAGLRGIGFGDFLIKRVVQDLRAELPSLRDFVTLSPMPGFRRWVESTATETVTEMTGVDVAAVLAVRANDGALTEEQREDLLRLGASYLVRAKRGPQPADPVARFHLGNGARVERINWAGDTSAKGVAESYGLMVNYRYELSQIESRHEAYATEGTIAVSDEVRVLLRRNPR